MSTERERLERIRILDVARVENSFEFLNIVEITAEIFNAPIAAITVLDSDTQWFFASKGLQIDRSERCDAFCNITIEQDTPFVVEDALAQAAFAHNRYVTEDPHLRFYAGAPISLTPGLRIGALIVIDQAPRKVDSGRLRQLERLADVAAEAFRQRGHVACVEQLSKKLTERERFTHAQNQLLQETQEVFEVASELANFGSWSLDFETNTVTWSRGVKRIHGVADDFEPTLENAISFYEPEARPAIEAWVRKAIASGEDYSIEQPIRTAAGERKTVRSIGRVGRDEHNVPKRLYGCALDVTEERCRQEITERLATRDALTDLMNRRSIEAAYAKRLAVESDATTLQLMLLDLDHFKFVNDSEGHAVGDRVLQCFAQLLRRSARSSDSVARLGGDEFLMMIESPDADAGARVAERVLAQARQEPLLCNRATPVSTSIGLSGVSSKGLDFAAALKCADVALYEAKRLGRNRMVRYQPSLGASHVKRREELTRLAAALDEGRVAPAYQMQRRLSDGRLCGFEALARVHDPERGLLTPGAFPTAFQDRACVNRISNTILEQVAADAAKVRALGLDFGRISVNVAELQLLDEDFEERLDDLVMRRQLSHEDFVLELTETILLSAAADRVKERLARLQRRGVAVAFDDFGTGYASLTHLRAMPIDQLKIDRSFVGSLLTDQTCRTITKSIVEMASMLGIETVAEGVETIEVAETLRGFNCDLVQGFLYSKPVLFDAMLEQLRAENRPIVHQSSTG